MATLSRSQQQAKGLTANKQIYNTFSKGKFMRLSDLIVLVEKTKDVGFSDDFSHLTGKKVKKTDKGKPEKTTETNTEGEEDTKTKGEKDPASKDSKDPVEDTSSIDTKKGQSKDASADKKPAGKKSKAEADVTHEDDPGDLDTDTGSKPGDKVKSKKSKDEADVTHEDDPGDLDTDDGEPGEKSEAEADVTHEDDPGDLDTDDGEPGEKSKAEADVTHEDDPGDMEEDDGEPGDDPSDVSSDDSTDKATADVTQTKIKVEKLYDDVTGLKKLYAELSKNVSNLSSGKSSDKSVIQNVNNLLKTGEEQLDTIIQKFASLKYDKVLLMYSKLKERLSTCSSVLSQLIKAKKSPNS